ncbi:hypothetical protein OFB93_28065, partial [Escherichia coli]|nr:hypothetical protein [Escherichia coli]
IEILAQLEDARDNYANFTYFLKHLIAASVTISPQLARALVESEDALIQWAESKFAANDESSNHI